jgi:signal transduction histidine kinase
MQLNKDAGHAGHTGSGSENSTTTVSDASVAHADTGPRFNLSTLTEDAVTAACLGFDQRSQQSQSLHGPESDHPATLILNIDDALSSDWDFSVASGSWKRICINLVLNALKYTPSGYINVTLQKTMLKRKPGKQRSAVVELVVSWSSLVDVEIFAKHVTQVEDSGIGMSDEFQAKGLFRPFRQENELTPGTGLVSVESCISNADHNLTPFG